MRAEPRASAMGVAAALVLALFVGAHAVLAQGNQGADAASSEGSQRSTASQVHAGANTTAGTTEGNSGPTSPSSGDRPPERPTAALCDAFGSDVHAACLAVVTRGPSDSNTGGNP